jgi:hypothetical protein
MGSLSTVDLFFSVGEILDKLDFYRENLLVFLTVKIIDSMFARPHQIVAHQNSLS